MGDLTAREEADRLMTDVFGGDERWRKSGWSRDHRGKIEASLTDFYLRGEAAGRERAASAALTVNVCSTCKTPFTTPPGHYDEDCPKGRASWECPTRTDIAEAIISLPPLPGDEA